jgi:hypothetical protein
MKCASIVCRSGGAHTESRESQQQQKQQTAGSNQVKLLHSAAAAGMERPDEVVAGSGSQTIRGWIDRTSMVGA